MDRRFDEKAYEDYCDVCGVFDAAGMDGCPTHNTRYCRRCGCPECLEDDLREDCDDWGGL